jgi:histidyl-tRNA synthetase
MKYKRPIGTQDVTPDSAPEWRFVEESFRDLAARYGYGEIRTPVFEDTDLFLRSVGKETDIASKEMYTFEDRGQRSQTLRAEGTAPAVRAYLENHLDRTDKQRLVKLYYIVPIFRYDRPQAGRYRQHHQLGIEAIGSPDPAVDAEVISLAWNFYAQMGLTGVTLRLNSVGCPACAPDYVDKLKQTLAGSLDSLCGDCQRRYHENPLRMLDCKVCHDFMTPAPRLVEELCGDCEGHLRDVLTALDTLGVPHEMDHTIVRGLDYYTKTAFEFQIEGIGAQSALGGGGRYDGLVEQCGGPPTPGVGLGIGLERVLLARETLGQTVAGTAGFPARAGVFLVALGDAVWPDALRLVQELRLAGIKADLDYRKRSLKAQLRHADNELFAQAIILGENELGQGIVGLKNLETGEQVEVARTDLLARLSPDPSRS